LMIGSSAVSLGLLLAAYMVGLSLGSAALPWLVSARRHPLRVYACLEFGIGAFGLVILLGLPLIGHIYNAGAMSGIAGLVARGVVAAACLVPPTLLMGASFPAIARWVEMTAKPISWLGALYTANIAGAVVGCVVAGFYLLRVYDMAVATYAAAGINAIVAVLALVSAGAIPWRRSDIENRKPTLSRRAPGSVLVYVAIALSGLTALGAEVVWTRLLSLLLGATVYTFSI